MSPSPTPFHQLVSMRLCKELLGLVDRGLGVVLQAPIDVFLSETETYQPDLIFIAASRRSIIGEQKIEGAPDLVIEILSPGTAYYDLRHKKHVYEQAGVKEYWIVDPMEHSIEIYESRDGAFVQVTNAVGDETARSGLFESLVVELKTIFQAM